MSRFGSQKRKGFICQGLYREGKGAIAGPKLRRRPMNHKSVARPAS